MAGNRWTCECGVMTFPRYHGRASSMPDIVEKLEALLARDWDADGELVRAARDIVPYDDARPNTLRDYAAAVCGILAAGGSAAEVRGYLRRVEEELLGEARSEGPTRGSIAVTAWRIVRGIE